MTYPVRKVLTFRASSIGDTLIGKYFLENVHAAYPDARCGIVVAGRVVYAREVHHPGTTKHRGWFSRVTSPADWRLVLDRVFN